METTDTDLQAQAQAQAKEKAKSDQLRLKAEYERNLIVNAPKENDIGQTICKNTPLSAYTGTLVYGQPTYNQVEGIVIASLEGFSNDKQNIKINIKGWLNNSNQVSSGRDVLYKQLIADLGEASTLVAWPNQTAYTSSVERVNKAFVKAFRARLAMVASGFQQYPDGVRRSTDPELSVAFEDVWVD